LVKVHASWNACTGETE